MNEEEKKAIEILKEIEINTYAEGKAIAIDTVLKLIKKLQKENEELKFKERRRIIGKYGDAEIHDVINKTLSNDYISVQKVKDKISERQFELQQEYKDFEDDAILIVLQELLEGRK
jgi:hypothetical protein